MVNPVRSIGGRTRRGPALAAAALILVLGIPAVGGELEVADGVVVKFGPNGELIVRDGLILQGQAIFTSLNDDAILGAARAAPATPAPGDWRGLRLERSAPASLTRLEGLSVFYGGSGIPAFTLRSTSQPLSGFTISRSAGAGLLASAGVTSRLRELILTQNQIGFEGEAGSAVVLESSLITGNTLFGARNLGSAIPANGNWWGHPTGPLDASDDRASGGLYNPGGLGDPVSDGILYDPVASAVPLFGLAIQPAGGGVTAQPIVTFILRGPTAIGARLSEDPAFAGVPFQPFTGLQTLALSPSDGLKTIYAQFQAATGNTATISTQVRLDSSGPALAVVSPAPGAVLTRPLAVLANAADASGVARVEFYVDGALVFTDTTNTFSFDWDIRNAGDGPHVLGVVAVDNVGRTTRQDLNVAVAAAPPGAPAITNPVSGTQTTATSTPVTGTAEPNVVISVYSNGALAGRAVSSAAGLWSVASVGLIEGGNTLVAVASDRVGSGPASPPVAVTRDSGPPSPPALLAPKSLANGVKRLEWLPPTDEASPTFSVYRATSSFTSKAQATRIQTGLTSSFTTDTPPSQGAFFYAVTAIDPALNESALSNLVQVAQDTTPPAAAVTASPAGVVGPGPVTLTVVVSEPIDADPFVSVTPQGGSPTVVTMTPTGAPLTWSGPFDVTGAMNAGPAAVSFSGRDLATNRGTQITSGGTIVLDTRGPTGTIVVTPQRALGPGTYGARLTLNETPSGTPELRFLPPVGSPVTLALTGSGLVWDAALVIDASMGDGPGRFDLTATDLLGNTASGVVPGAGVDLDNTPPAAPSNFTATTLAGGSIRLAWTIVGDAAQYVVDREDGDLIFGNGARSSLPATAAPTLTDLPPADGAYAYVVRAVDAAGNFSVDSAPAAALSDRTPPGDPSGVTLAVQGNGIRIDWTAPLVDPADTFALFRSTSPITSLAGLLPIQTGLTQPTAFDRPPSDGVYHYAVAGRDAAGNQGGFAAAGPFTFDFGDPVITIGGVADQQVSNLPLTITFSATDLSLLSVTATLDGGPFASGGTVSAEGDHTLIVEASDSSGNTALKTIAFAIDTTPPAVTVTGVVDGDELGAAVTPVITISDDRPAASSVLLNGAPFTSGTAITQDGSYALVIHAEDLAGNVTDVAINFTIDAAPPAVASLNVDLPQDGFPHLSWPARPEPDVVGYFVDRGGIRLTPAAITALTFTDSGFDPFSVQTYTVVAVDTAGHEGAPRTATLPLAALSVSAGGPGGTLTRRYLDSVAVTIQNTGAAALPVPASVEMTLRDGATVLATRTRATAIPIPPGGSITLSDVFSTGDGASATRDLDVALTLPSEPDTRVRRIRTLTLPVREPGRPVELFNDPIVLGGTARITLKVLNQGSARLQVKTSEAGGPTADVEVRITDLDGNVLGSGRLDHRGAGVINTANLAFAEIPAGSTYLSRSVQIPVPSNAPSDVVIEAVVNVTHSDLLGSTDVTGPALAGSVRATTGNPPYLATAAPDRGVYDQGETVQISGRAFDTTSGAPVPDSLVKIGISTRGFDRVLFATSDPNGDFVTSFNPLATEAGEYLLWATHPSVTERQSQSTFDILGLSLDPRSFNLRMSQNSTFDINLKLKNVGETPLSGFAFGSDTGSGVTASVDDTPVSGGLDPGKTAQVVVHVAADPNADLANFATIQITTAEGVVRTFDVNIQLLTALPTIQTTPTYTEVGLGNGTIVTRNVRIKNLGYAPLRNIALEPPGTPWITLGVDPNLPDIPVGGETDVPVIFAPPASITPAIYSDRLIIRSSNHVPYTQNLFAIVTSSTTGDATFEVRNTENVLLPNASVWIQNLQVPTLTFSRNTDPNGVTTFEQLPTGPYQYRVQATGVEPAVGKFDVSPDQVTPISLILNVVYVSFEWSVTPVVIEDRYDFKLTATFETHVPAPVLVADPPNFNIVLEPGATYVGEYKLTNHGLVAGDNLRITASAGPGLVLETLVTELPRIEAMQTITVPFRLTMLGPSGTAGPAPSPAPGVVAEGAAVGGGVVAANGGGFDPCKAQPAYTYNAVVYTCTAGITSSSSVTVNVAARPALNTLGICDEGCNPCECIPGFAGNICKCIKGLAQGQGPTCDCLIHGGAADACSCLTAGDPVACMKLIPGPIGEAAGVIDFGVRCILNIARCVCQFAPSVCAPGGGSAGGGGGGGGGWGGYGGGYGGVSSNVGCN